MTARSQDPLLTERVAAILSWHEYGDENETASETWARLNDEEQSEMARDAVIALEAVRQASRETQPLRTRS